MQKKLTFIALLLMALLMSVRPLCAQNYPSNNDFLWVTVPDHPDWLYKSGETASVEVQLYRYGIPQEAEVAYEIAKDMMPAERTGKLSLKNGRAVLKLGTLKDPGFLDCKFSVEIDGQKSHHHVKVGFSPEQLKPYTSEPKDFDEFWTTSLSQARKHPLSFTMRKVDAYTTDEFDCFLVKILYDGTHSVYGYLTKPKKTGKYPVVLCPPGAGIKTIKLPMRNTYYAKNGFIRLEIEIHGLNPELSDDTFKEISTAFTHENGYLENGLDNKDNYYMRHVYVACVRCIDFLTQLDEWDGKNVAVQGGSQGGALSIVTAGLDSRVTHCVANHPALSDMAGYKAGRAGGYPHFNKENGMLTDQKILTMSYFDVVNFAKRVKADFFMTWGYNDNVCPPTTSYIVWNLVTAPKEALVTPINEHWTSETTNRRQMQWIKQRLK
jgi:cephalosporin-C deacetylase-like acetyl esterase